MKLNKKDLNNYRRVINEALKDVEGLHSIKLPKETLDLLFFGYTKPNEIKRFQYSFDSISSLDLSDYSFEGVSFNSDIPVNLSNINAKIDFKKTYTGKIDGHFKLRNIDFSKTDLSESNLSGVTLVENCNFKDTNATWPTDFFTAKNTDFTNNNMSSIFITVMALTKYNYLEKQSFTNCIFTNTGLHFETRDNGRLQHLYPHFDDVLSERRRVVNEMVESGALVGCYINSNLIRSKEDLSIIAEDKLGEYNTFKSQTIDKTLRLIKSQTNSAGGKSIK